MGDNMNRVKNLAPTLKIGVISFKKGFASQGVKKTFQMFGEALVDEYYNHKCGLDVSGFYDPADCSESLPNKGHANYYQPVRYRPFFRLFKHYNIVPRGRFVDIGAGKGKAMVLAAQVGYQDLLGIELFDDLTQVARKNLEKFKQSEPRYGDLQVELKTMDATDYVFDQKDQFIFMNDPFSDEPMQKLVDNIIKSYKEHPRELWVVFKNNNQRNLPSVYNLKEFSEYTVFEFSGNYFEVFRFSKA